MLTEWLLENNPDSFAELVQFLQRILDAGESNGVLTRVRSATCVLIPNKVLEFFRLCKNAIEFWLGLFQFLIGF
jgi:hypothetical protein